VTTAQLEKGAGCTAFERPERMTDPSAPLRDAERGHTLHPAKWWIAAGIFFTVLAAYILSSPGRIDIIDGQTRYDVTRNWLLEGRPVLTDSWIGPYMGVVGRDDRVYSLYGAPASVFAMPLVWLDLHSGSPSIERSRFLFSLTSPILGAGIAVVLFLFFVELGLPRQWALVWSMVSSFSSLVWPASNSTFDNAQHAFFAIASLYLGFLSAKRASTLLAAVAGSLAGILVLYQEYFLLIIPVLAISTVACAPARSSWDEEELPSAPQSPSNGPRAWFALLRTAFRGPGEARSSCIRLVVFLAAATFGLLLSLAYNDLRFGTYLLFGKVHAIVNRHPLFGNPLAGSLTLLVSPGKSIFLYSPTIVLGILGIRSLWRRHPALAFAISAASLILILFLSCIAFVGGDWCWGPRYLVSLLPAWALAMPFALRDRKVRRDVVLGIIALGLLVQVLALSVENQRFFLERGLNDYFWAEDPWFYFKHSAIFARIGETLSLNRGLPATAQLFNSIPIPDWSTYSLLGPPPFAPRSIAPVWMRGFKIFYLPRPWPLWMAWIPPAMRPINMRAWVLGLLAVNLLGIGLIYRGLRIRGDHEQRV